MTFLKEAALLRARSAILLTSAFCLLFHTASTTASFENALKIYSDGDFEEARIAFETMAAIGDSSSLFNLGVMYYRGEAVERDLVKGYVLMKIATEGSKDDSFEKTKDSIFSKFNASQKEKSNEVYNELLKIYGIENIQENILPALLDDKDCPPDLVPIKRSRLVYPESKLVTGKMGLVHAEFIISPEGYPREINITSSTDKAFSKNSIAAIENYLYAPTHDSRPKEERLILAFKIRADASQTRVSKLRKDLNGLRDKSANGDSISQFYYARKLNGYRVFKQYFEDQDFQYREANEWFTKSASGGVVNAQFEIGRNMLEGRGCKVDTENGFKWIKAAAISGYSPAQKYLANSVIIGESNSKNNAHSVVSWLRNASQNEDAGFPAKVLLAWELATSAEKSILAPDESLTLLKKTHHRFKDDLRIIETRAAAYAMKNNFKKAVKLQSSAVRLANKKGWEISKVTDRLELYKDKRPYIGSYY